MKLQKNYMSPSFNLIEIDSFLLSNFIIEEEHTEYLDVYSDEGHLPCEAL